MGQDNTPDHRNDDDAERIAPRDNLGEAVPPMADEMMDRLPETEADEELDAGQPDSDLQYDVREMEALYGKELSRARDSLERWRVQQAKAAFRIGDLWEDLSERLTEKEVTAFLANECHVPRRDVKRYVRLANVFGKCPHAGCREDADCQHRELLIDNGVAVSVLLDLAGQDEHVRGEAFRMIRSGRSLQAGELRGLKRDIGLARAARDGLLDKRRIRDFRNAAARKARAAADAWIASLEKMANETIALAELDKSRPVASTAANRVDRLTKRAAKLLEELPAVVGKEFAKAPVRTSPGSLVKTGTWQQVFATLTSMSKGKMFLKEFYERPETTVYGFDHSIVSDLAWAFGYDEDARATAIVERMREAGDVPLDAVASNASSFHDMRNKPTVLEICAGAGGQAIGLDAAGFKHVGLVEIDRDAADTILHNRPEWPVMREDLRGLDLSAFEGVDLLAGGVPCQPYSAAGERRRADDERDLFPEALRLVSELKPKAVMLENVTGALEAGNSVNRLRILSELSALGYEAEWRILNGWDFGLPQKRRRAVLVGFRPGIMHRFRWPTPLATRAPTVGEALYDLMAANSWPHVDAWKERANGLAPTLIGGSQKKRGIDLAQKKSRESWNDLGINPSYRAKAAPGPDAPADLMPRLTLVMMARIQGFPGDWEFQGSDLQVFRQIANAFPPAMAQAVGLSIMRALTGTEIRLEDALSKPREKKPSLNLKAIRALMPDDEAELAA